MASVRGSAAHFAAPAAFLLVVTIVVLLVRSSFQHDSSTPPPPTTAAHVTTATGGPRTGTKPIQAAQYYKVESGDTLGAIAYRFHTTVERLMTLNPGIEPTALHIGQRIRVA